jgi:FMN phosphatase YigB (HAD superfamily)
MAFDMSGITTIVFDFDGTLYDEPVVYDRFMAELAAFVPTERRGDFQVEWALARAGRHALQVGMGYDVQSDTLFRYQDGAALERFDWSGRPLPPEQWPATAQGVTTPGAGPESGGARSPDADAAAAPPEAPPIETVLFGAHALNVGDLWGLADTLAAHYGLERRQRASAFMATRAYMDGPEFPMAPASGLVDALTYLRGRGLNLTAMTNSPPDTTRAVLSKLGIWDLFDTVQTMARKPNGMREFLAAQAEPAAVLSVGDNFINEIEPALQAGGAALYIDRFATGFGAAQPRCARVGSISEMAEWLRRL